MDHLIIYDLRSPGRNYTMLLNAIADCGPHDRIARSCWIVHSNLNAKQIHDYLINYIDYTDILFVCTFSHCAYRGTKQFPNWLTI